MGPPFNVSFERQLIIARLTSPGIEPKTLSFQVECSNQLSYEGWSTNWYFLDRIFIYYSISCLHQYLQILMSCFLLIASVVKRIKVLGLKNTFVSFVHIQDTRYAGSDYFIPVVFLCSISY